MQVRNQLCICLLVLTSLTIKNVFWASEEKQKLSYIFNHQKGSSTPQLS